MDELLDAQYADMGKLTRAFEKATASGKGNMSSTSTVTSVETGAVAADLFLLPAGYKIKEQQ